MAEYDVHIIGGGLAGSEAAWQLAEAGFRVRLSEMRGGGDMTPAHQGDALAEMVCSNSFRSDDGDSNAVGLLHREMRTLGSIIMREADVYKVPAGSALAVDRDLFSGGVTRALENHPNIDIVRERIDTLPTILEALLRCAAHRRRPRLEHRRRDRQGRPRLLRCHRPDRLPRQRRHGHCVDGQPLGQSRTDRRRQGLYQLPDGQGPIPCLRPGTGRRRQDRVQGVGDQHPLFRRLHADRGDGRTRPRNAALRPDEGRRPRQSAHRALALCRRPAAPG